MVKKKKKTKNTVSIFGRQFPAWVLVVGFFAVAIVGFVGYNAYLDYQDQQKFTRMENTVLELTKRINEEFGTETIEIQEYCRYNTEKYTRGSLFCSFRSISTTNQMSTDAVFDWILTQNDLVETSLGYSEGFNEGRVSLAGISAACLVGIDSAGEIYPPVANTQTDNENEWLTIKCSASATNEFFPIID